VNDLAVSGATPRYLSLSAIIEEGLELAILERIIKTMAEAAKGSSVQIACGDTKVVPRGEGSGIYLTTTGIGVRNRGLQTNGSENHGLQNNGSQNKSPQLGLRHIKAGDCILVSGPVGDHGAAIMLAREQFGLRGDIQSDSASVFPLCSALYDLLGLRFMRDPTRGGLATVLHEIHRYTALGIRVRQGDIPVRAPVTSVCEILGYDPMYLACEGRVVAVTAGEDAQEALARWHALPQGRDARIIGQLNDSVRRVVLETELGGERVLEELEDDPLPRIC
jgi:hydrogenase expression/formation protein HypE